MHRFCFLLVAVALFLGAVACSSAQTPGVKIVSNGEFKDKDGAIHAWRIDGAHTLIWDGKPYIPVGGVFYPRYICNGATEENWQADAKALESIKSSGIADLLLKPIGPITATDPAAWQRLLDYLDSNDFTYGIDLSDGPRAPVSGVVIDPMRYRTGGAVKETFFQFNIPDVVSALWILCTTTDGRVISSGGADVANGQITIDIKSRPLESAVLLVYPTLQPTTGVNSGTGDLWAGFDEFRDSMLAFCSKLKFGKGLRFFLDPITSKMDLDPKLASFIPDSAEFRLEFEAYLVRKYKNIGSLNSAWGLNRENLDSFQTAARVMPLWYGARGITAVYDKARGKRYAADVALSTLWKDIVDFRDYSVQGYLNSAAELLKRNVAEVPVIYRATSYNRIFANTISTTGFDGLGVDAYGRGEPLGIDQAAPIYALSEESACSMWLVVTGTQDTRSRDKSTSGYSSKEVLTADLGVLAEAGVKGIFVNGLQVLPDDIWKNHSLASMPDQMGWLKSFKDSFVADRRADYVPQVIYYPVVPMTGAHTARLGPGQWWLPSFQMGGAMIIGDTIAAYTIPGHEGICIWSRVGPQTVTFPMQPEFEPTIKFPLASEGILTVDKKNYTLKLGNDPVVLLGIDPVQVFPLETVDAEIAKLKPLAQQAKEAGSRVPDVSEAIKRATDLMKHGRSAVAYDVVHTMANRIQQELGSYVWLEGESAISHSFESVVTNAKSSSGAYLNLDTTQPPPMSPYGAAYIAQIDKVADYDVWVALSPTDGTASQISFSFDAGPWHEAPPERTISDYQPGFGWVKIGSIRLAIGQHLLQLRVDKPNSDGVHRLALDAIVLSPVAFKPDGIRKP